MFRMVNERPGLVSDVRVRVLLSWFEMFDGERERNFHALQLERDQVELFNLHWTVVHPIDANSPLRGMTPDDLRQAEAEFVISVTAHEESFSSTVRQRTSYKWDEMRWDVKFASIFTSAPDDVIAIDVERLSRTEPLPEGSTRTPAKREEGPAIKLS
jgi:inward rectifier potassium channel